MGFPLVSAIVAAYNYDRFLPRTLDSALAQEYPRDKLEIVVVDDGSTDDTHAILNEYAGRYPGRIRVFRQENAGYVAATNRAFAEARGELWALLDADDLWPTQKTIRQVEIFKAYPQVGAVYGDLTIIDADDQILRLSHWRHEQVRPLRGSGALTSLLAERNIAGASSIMVRASLRQRFAPVPDGVPYVDWWVVMQAAAVSELEYMLEPRVGYREHGGNLTQGAQGIQLAREMIKQSMTRRQMLIHGGAAALPAHALRAAWEAVERDAIGAVHAAGTAFVDFPRASAAARAAADAAAARAMALEHRGRIEAALRCWLVAAAHDPFENHVKTAIRQAGERLAAGEVRPDPFEGARSFAVLADAREVIARPELLATFADHFGLADDATLVIHAPEIGAGEVEQALLAALSTAGLDPENSIDMLALPDPAHVTDCTELARAADALLRDGAGEGLRARYAQVVALPSAPS